MLLLGFPPRPPCSPAMQSQCHTWALLSCLITCRPQKRPASPTLHQTDKTNARECRIHRHQHKRWSDGRYPLKKTAGGRANGRFPSLCSAWRRKTWQSSLRQSPYSIISRVFETELVKLCGPDRDGRLVSRHRGSVPAGSRRAPVARPVAAVPLPVKQCIIIIQDALSWTLSLGHTFSQLSRPIHVLTVR